MSVRRCGSSVVAGMVALALLAACSSSSKSAATTTANATDTKVATTSAPTTPSTPSTSATPATSAAPAESVVATTPAPASTDATTTTADPALIRGLQLTLLTAVELNAINGFDLTARVFDVNKPSAPPCGGAGADQTVPPLAKVGASWQSQSVDVLYNEEIRVYADAATAAEALAAGEVGFACGKSTDGTFTFAAPQDVTSQVTTSTTPPAGETFKVIEIDVSGSQFEGAVYVVDFSDSLTVIQALRKVGLTDAQSGPDPQIVLGKAIDKLFATAAAGSTSTTTS